MNLYSYAPPNNIIEINFELNKTMKKYGKIFLKYSTIPVILYAILKSDQN